MYVPYAYELSCRFFFIHRFPLNLLFIHIVFIIREPSIVSAFCLLFSFFLSFVLFFSFFLLFCFFYPTNVFLQPMHGPHWLMNLSQGAIGYAAFQKEAEEERREQQRARNERRKQRNEGSRDSVSSGGSPSRGRKGKEEGATGATGFLRYGARRWENHDNSSSHQSESNHIQKSLEAEERVSQFIDYIFLGSFIVISYRCVLPSFFLFSFPFYFLFDSLCLFLFLFCHPHHLSFMSFWHLECIHADSQKEEQRRKLRTEVPPHGRRVNKQHGFISQIVNIQQDRDKYEMETRKKKREKEEQARLRRQAEIEEREMRRQQAKEKRLARQNRQSEEAAHPINQTWTHDKFEELTNRNERERAGSGKRVEGRSRRNTRPWSDDVQNTKGPSVPSASKVKGRGSVHYRKGRVVRPGQKPFVESRVHDTATKTLPSQQRTFASTSPAKSTSSTPSKTQRFYRPPRGPRAKQQTASSADTVDQTEKSNSSPGTTTTSTTTSSTTTTTTTTTTSTTTTTGKTNLAPVSTETTETNRKQRRGRKKKNKKEVKETYKSSKGRQGTAVDDAQLEPVAAFSPTPSTPTCSSSSSSVSSSSIHSDRAPQTARNASRQDHPSQRSKESNRRGRGRGMKSKSAAMDEEIDRERAGGQGFDEGQTRREEADEIAEEIDWQRRVDQSAVQKSKGEKAGKKAKKKRSKNRRKKSGKKQEGMHAPTAPLTGSTTATTNTAANTDATGATTSNGTTIDTHNNAVPRDLTLMTKDDFEIDLAKAQKIPLPDFDDDDDEL